MTDLTAYEQALVERVEQAFALWRDPADSPRTSALLALASLGLLGPSRTAWIAPWEASEGMRRAAHMAGNVGDNGGHEAAPFDEQWAAMRDMHTTGKAKRGLWSLMER